MKRKKVEIILGVFLLIYLIVLSFFTFTYKRDSGGNPEEIQEVDSIEILIQDQVYDFIKEINVAHPEVVYAQAKLESGNFKSKLFIEYNNIFGMKMPERRPTIAIGVTKSGFAVYESWKHSIIDYAIYQVYSAKGLSQEKYIEFLNRVYAEDNEYDVKIKRIIEEL